MPETRYPVRAMTAPRKTGGRPRPNRRKVAGSAETIGRAAVAHEGEPVPGGKVKLTLRITLSRTQGERLAARAIREGKNLDALVAEILEAAPTEPTT